MFVGYVFFKFFFLSLDAGPDIDNVIHFVSLSTFLFVTDLCAYHIQSTHSRLYCPVLWTLSAVEVINTDVKGIILHTQLMSCSAISSWFVCFYCKVKCVTNLRESILHVNVSRKLLASAVFHSTAALYITTIHNLLPIITLRAKLRGAVYCYRSCLWRVSGRCLWITRNCVHRSSPNWICK